ncbi:MAG: efflux RND transporter periplasmic adaptor subunit [Halieaceae bacterium]
MRLSVAPTFVTIVLAGLLTACGKEEAPVEPPASRPVKTYTVDGGTAQAIRQFPARVDASQRAEMSFRVSGQLEKIAVREGDLVAAGDLIAKLDPTDYQIVLNDRRATFDNAERNFTRGKELIVDGNISRIDYDRMEANYRTSEAALAQAEKDLEYTEMRAPFSGRIARRMVENFEEVLAKQTVFYLQDNNSLDVMINLPESLVRSVKANANVGDIDDVEAIDSRREKLPAWVSFDDKANTQFPLEIKEIATKADDQTQTYQVTFTMKSPEDFTVLPGMTASVSVDFANVVVSDGAHWVPVRSVQGDTGLESRVWVLNGQDMTVSSRQVTIGRMSEGRIEVTSGLQGGEEIVAVGGPYLAEGMRVTRMVKAEQAIPRADDPA